MTSDSTRWPLLDERAPFATAAPRTRRRRLPRSSWLLIALAFLCGGLVSAAGFSIGWRHQAQRDTAARAELAAATARIDRLSAALATARETATQERQAAAAATAAARATSHAASSLGAEASAAGHTAEAVAGSAGDIATTAARVTSELQTLLTYLTTTPSGQIDSGYVASQASYLTRQMTNLQDAGGNVAKEVAQFDAAVRRIARDAKALPQH